MRGGARRRLASGQRPGSTRARRLRHACPSPDSTPTCTRRWLPSLRASGTSVITENLYDARFRYVGELARMGADITTEAQHAIVSGVDNLSGCPVLAPDIRAGAALVLAGLGPKGRPG